MGAVMRELLGWLSAWVRAALLLPEGAWTLGQVLVVPLLVLVRGYQVLISPLTPPSCRFFPCCSSYAVTALGQFGPLRGSWLVVRRLLRCHPWNPGGTDHVPHREGATPASALSQFSSHSSECAHPAPDDLIVTASAHTTP